MAIFRDFASHSAFMMPRVVSSTVITGISNTMPKIKNTVIRKEIYCWILTEADSEALSRNAVHKVVQNYSQQSVAMKYLDVYHQAMAFKHYRL